jgi:hypothetical protein
MTEYKEKYLVKCIYKGNTFMCVENKPNCKGFKCDTRATFIDWVGYIKYNKFVEEVTYNMTKTGS